MGDRADETKGRDPRENATLNEVKIETQPPYMIKIPFLFTPSVFDKAMCWRSLQPVLESKRGRL